MDKYPGLFLHTCGMRFTISSRRGKLTFRQTSFMSAPRKKCPRCGADLKDGDFTSDSEKIEKPHLTNASQTDTVLAAPIERA